MPKFDSPIGSKQFQGQQMKNVSISDESNTDQHYHEPTSFDDNNFKQVQSSGIPREMSDVEQQIFAAKKAKREGKEKLSEGARRRVEMLIEMVRVTRDVTIDDKLYRLRTLQSKELRDALVATAEFDGTIQMIFETRKQLLARSLIVVAGVEIANFLNSNDLQDRLNFIEELDHSLLLRLYNEYVSLAAEAEDKYSLKTEQQVKEVLEDLKK